MGQAVHTRQPADMGARAEDGRPERDSKAAEDNTPEMEIRYGEGGKRNGKTYLDLETETDEHTCLSRSGSRYRRGEAERR
jgi:hypothetical protein